MKTLRLASLWLALAVLAGCAHPMIIKPEMEALSTTTNAERIQKKVGLYISAANRTKEVTTPGGGGDKVRYVPYGDIEPGLYKVLGDVFQDVSILPGTDADSIAKHSVAYVIEPEISTTSSSSGFFTWMATDFEVQLQCKISDASGQTVTTVSSVGTGKASSSELMQNFSLAGQRASQDALIKLRESLLQSADLKK
ncbi:MAG TPA: hypothetical protein VH814_24780 [Steroidobacteraceae bacterium]|jgi:hypothetical protein